MEESHEASEDAAPERPVSEFDPLRLESYQGYEVVVDTDCALVYVGVLDAVDDHFLLLSAVDVHDMSDSNTTKERYILESRRFGVRQNRQQVVVARPRMVSLSLLADVMSF